MYSEDSDDHPVLFDSDSPPCPASPRQTLGKDVRVSPALRCLSAEDLHVCIMIFTSSTVFQFMLTNTIPLQQRLLFTKLQRAVKKQEVRLQSLSSELRAIKSEALEVLEGCADESDSDGGTVTPLGPGHSNNHDWSHANAMAISTALFAKLAVGSGVAVEAGPIPTTRTAVDSTTQSNSLPVPPASNNASQPQGNAAASGSTVIQAAPAPGPVRRTRGRKLRREYAWIHESPEDLIQP